MREEDPLGGGYRREGGRRRGGEGEGEGVGAERKTEPSPRSEEHSLGTVIRFV